MTQRRADAECIDARSIAGVRPRRTRVRIGPRPPTVVQPSRMNEATPIIAVELIPDPEHGGFTARVPDVPAYGEGKTEDEAIADLREALRGYIETFGLQDALRRVSSPSTIRHMDWNLADFVRG